MKYFILRMVIDSECCVVVLLFEAARILRHVLLHPSEERETADVPSRLPSFHYVFPVVDRHQVGAERFDLSTCYGQLVYPRPYVLLLRIVVGRTEYIKVPLVEEISYYVTAGESGSFTFNFLIDFSYCFKSYR